MKTCEILLTTWMATVLVCPGAQSTRPVIEDITLVPRLTIRSDLGVINIIEYAEVLPITQWRVLTNLVVIQSPYVVVDLATPASQRIYRVKIPPPDPNAPAMVFIPAGTYTMGSPTYEADRYTTEVEHTVTITKGFLMGKYEVTQGEYQAVTGGSNPSLFPGDSQLPVEQVSWDNATNYCGMLTQQERAAGRLPLGYEYRLPTEAEWEYACRAGTKTATAYGNSLSSHQANFDGNIPYNGGAKGWYLARTTTVGSYVPNAWGLYDMHGNVAEWCLDWYGQYPGGRETDPKGPCSGSIRVFRGGGWTEADGGLRSACRNGTNPVTKAGDLGFRVVLAPSP